MRAGPIGGWLVVGGSVLYLTAVAIVLAGGGTCTGCVESSGRRVTDPGGVVIIAGTALIGAGSAVLAIAGPTPFHALRMRLSLGALTVGLLTYLAVLVVSVIGASETAMDAAVLLALSAMVIGPLATGLSLVTMRGPSRAVGVLFLVGLLLLVLREVLRPYVADDAPLGAVAALGWAAVFLSGLGVGLLGIYGDRSTSLVPT